MSKTVDAAFRKEMSRAMFDERLAMYIALSVAAGIRTLEQAEKLYSSALDEYDKRAEEQQNDRQ